jgi:hypothetical protein
MGLCVHAGVAFDADDGALLGVCHAQLLKRKDEEGRKGGGVPEREKNQRTGALYKQPLFDYRAWTG